MFNFLCGVLLTAAFFTFAPPAVAAKPSKWLRDAWTSIKRMRKG